MAYTKLHFTYKTYQRKALYHLFNKGKIILCLKQMLRVNNILDQEFSPIMRIIVNKFLVITAMFTQL